MQPNDRPALRAISFIVGVLTIVVGILFLALPAIVQIGNEWILAVLFIGGGLMNAGFAITTLRKDVRVYTILLTLLSLTAGFIILGNPLDRSITLTTLLGLFFLLESGLMAGLGTTIRPHWSATTVLYFVALISFVMSMLIWLRMAGAPKSTIVCLLGINFIARGVAFICISMMMRGQAPLPPAPSKPTETLAEQGGA